MEQKLMVMMCTFPVCVCGFLFLFVCFPLSLSQVWSLEQPDWRCKIDEGSIGLVSSRWSPDGRHILNTTEFHVSVKSGGVEPVPCQLSLPRNRGPENSRLSGGTGLASDLK